MNKQEKTDLILREALRVFARYGYRKTTIEDVAAGLNMTKGNLYLYFRDKKELYEKAVAYGLRRWQKSATDSIESSSAPAEQIIQYAINGWLYLSKDPEMQNIIVNDPGVFPLYPEEDHFYKINMDSMNLLKEIIKKGIDQGQFRKGLDLDNATRFLYSIYVLFIIRTYVKPETNSIEQLVEAARDILLKGLLVRNNE